MVESFLKYLQFEKRYSLKTIQSYKNDLSQFQNFLNKDFERTLIAEANHGLIRTWIVNLVEAKMDAVSVNRKIACLRSYYKFLLKEGNILKDPMVKIRVLKTKKKLPHFFQETELIKTLDQFKFSNDFEGTRDQIVLELLYGTGIRLSELINLKDHSFNLKNCTVKVLGKRNKERIIPFTEGLGRLIDNYKVVRNKNIDRKEENFLVTNSGLPLYPMLVNRIVKKYLSASNVDKKSPHVLRHTYATHLLDKGAEINAVKDLLGHSSLAATQVYTHNSMEKLKKVFDQAHPKA